MLLDFQALTMNFKNAHQIVIKYFKFIVLNEFNI